MPVLSGSECRDKPGTSRLISIFKYAFPATYAKTYILVYSCILIYADEIFFELDTF